MKNKTINIDIKKAITQKNKRWKGLGMVSANNSSRLLIDYKVQAPESYEKLLKLMFSKDGLNINHLKIEMGADINSTSGTEPCTKRFSDEKCDVTRGAGFILASDAKRINPEITLDMLWWSEPRWITDSYETGKNEYEKKQNLYKARYQWYRENLISAYEIFNLKFDYVSATQNERQMDCDWIKYLNTELKNEKNAPYDFSKIKIVAGEEVCTWNICDAMINDEDLKNAIDVIGSHYTSWSTENTKTLQNKYNKDVWFTEGSSPMGYSKGIEKYDGNGSGLSGLNNVLDIANRIITMVPCGGMTLYEIQPVIASYYDGVTFCHKQFITANTPWNGYYELDPGFYMLLNFSQFINKDWCFIEEACFGDGKPAGDGHAIDSAVYSYLSSCNPETLDWTTVITNTTSEEIEYDFLFDENNKNIFLYETTSWKKEDSLIKKSLDSKININKDKSKSSLKIIVKPNSIVTVTTLDKNPVNKISSLECTSKNTILKLPFCDDYIYDDKEKDFLEKRGYAPLYTCDIGGAFEIAKLDNEQVLQQKIELKNKANEWGYTPEPVTNFGDDRWYNYSASIDVQFFKHSDNSSYCGIGIRYNLPDAGKNGLWIQLYKDGKWKLNKGKNILKEGCLEDFTEDDSYKWTNIKISAVDNTVEAFINHKCVARVDDKSFEENYCAAGRCAIFSSYDKNYFKNLKIESQKNPYILRFDNFDDVFKFDNTWNHGLMESFKCYKRTVSHGKTGSVCELCINGSGFIITGFCNENTEISVKIDGETYISKISKGEYRDALYKSPLLKNGNHNIKITVLCGQLNIDSVEQID